MPNDTAEVALIPRTDESTSPSAITALLTLAVDKGVPVETLEKLMMLHERVSDRAAAREFAEALADFQRECPPITKTSRAKITTNSGTSFEYNYAELPHIAATVGPLLHQRGFSYSWDCATDKLLTATCTLRHVNGHKETASFSCPVESNAGMSGQQKHGAALSYAKRQSLIQVLGITTAEPDTDAGLLEPITREQKEELEQLADQVGADRIKFLNGYMKVASFEEITKQDFEKARIALGRKAKK